MFLRQNAGGDVILHDDHGETWIIAFEGPLNGEENTSPIAPSPKPTIQFAARNGEVLRVPYRGGAANPREMGFDETVVHFLDAQDG